MPREGRREGGMEGRVDYRRKGGRREGEREGLTEPQALAHASGDGNDVFDRPAHL
jgi:hypothetical protein